MYRFKKETLRNAWIRVCVYDLDHNEIPIISIQVSIFTRQHSKLQMKINKILITVFQLYHV